MIHVIGAILSLLIIWPSGFPAITVALEHYAPFDLAALRLFVAAILLALLAIPFKQFCSVRSKDLILMALIGIIGLAAYVVLLGFGQRTVPAAESSFIVSLTPIFVVIMATLFLDERIGWKTSLGITISFVGASIIALAKGDGGGLHFDYSAFYILIAAMTQAVMTLLQKKLLPYYNPFQITLYATLFGALCLVPFGWQGLEQAFRTPTNTATLSVVYLGIVPSVLGYLIWTYVLSKLPASKAASLLYVIPIMTALISWAWLGDVPGISTYIGGAIILFGVFIVNIRRAQKARERVSEGSVE